jgi:hypothetical protein
MITESHQLARDHAVREHLLRVATEERRAHLVRCVEMYEARGWDALLAEYRIRLDELDRLLLFANVAELTEGEKAEAFGK